MQQRLTTNDVRRILQNFGAVKPGVRAVKMVATLDQNEGETKYWNMNLPDSVISSAVQACHGLRGEASYTAFRQACMRTKTT